MSANIANLTKNHIKKSGQQSQSYIIRKMKTLVAFSTLKLLVTFLLVYINVN